MVLPLTKLTLISGNGLGGWTYEPSQAERTGNVNVDLDSIASEAAKILNSETENSSLDEIYRLGGTT